MVDEIGCRHHRWRDHIDRRNEGARLNLSDLFGKQAASEQLLTSGLNQRVLPTDIAPQCNHLALRNGSRRHRARQPVDLGLDDRCFLPSFEQLSLRCLQVLAEQSQRKKRFAGSNRVTRKRMNLCHHSDRRRGNTAIGNPRSIRDLARNQNGSPILLWLRWLGNETQILSRLSADLQDSLFLS